MVTELTHRQRLQLCKGVVLSCLEHWLQETFNSSVKARRFFKFSLMVDIPAVEEDMSSSISTLGTPRRGDVLIVVDIACD
jgi:hypothetical protein